jgi:hypothetical protein
MILLIIPGVLDADSTSGAGVDGRGIGGAILCTAAVSVAGVVLLAISR